MQFFLGVRCAHLLLCLLSAFCAGASLGWSATQTRSAPKAGSLSTLVKCISKVWVKGSNKNPISIAFSVERAS
jgi:hypothetical protein